MRAPCLGRTVRVLVAVAVGALAAATWASSALAAFPGANGRIVASRTTATATELVTMNPDGSGLVVVPTPGVDTPVQPRWSPDGSLIAFSDNGSSVYTVAPDGGGLALRASDAGFLAWAPDGDLSITTGDGLVDIDLATGDRETVVPLPIVLGDGGVVGASPFAWSPDGTRVALTGTTVPTGNNGDIYVVEVSSGTATAITRSPLFSPDAYTGGNTHPTWSPSGGSLVFRCAVWKYLGDLCRVGADGTGLGILTEPLPLTGGPFDPGPDYRGPVIAPDGTAIIDTVRDVGGLTTIERRNGAGGSPVAIVPPDADVTWSDPDWQALPPPPSADTDGDGVVDAIDSGPGQWNDPVAGNPPTTGSLVSTGGLAVLVEDATDPEGVRITTGPGTGTARVSVCGFATIDLPANADLVITCGSVTVRVVSGPVTIGLGGLASVTVPSGATAKVSQLTGATYSVQSLTGGPLTVRVDGVTGTVAAGATKVVAAWDFVGFANPVDNGGVLNSVKAGQAVPLKWRVLGANGAPITNLTSASITAQNLTCTSGAPVDEIEELAPGASALMNLGNGNYQLNWKTPSSYAGSCKTLKLDIGDGVTHDALFRFR